MFDYDKVCGVDGDRTLSIYTNIKYLQETREQVCKGRHIICTLKKLFRDLSTKEFHNPEYRALSEIFVYTQNVCSENCMHKFRIRTFCKRNFVNNTQFLLIIIQVPLDDQI